MPKAAVKPVESGHVDDSQQMISVLYDLHAYFNDRVFVPRETPLPRPIFTMSAESRKTFGHFWPGKWHGTEFAEQEKLAASLARGNKGTSVLREITNRPDEINLQSELGLNRPFEAVAATVYHEMCHQAQHHFPAVYGKAGAGNYHNKKWHAACQICGLETEGSKGFTTVTEAFRGFIAEFPRPDRWIARSPGGKTKAPTKLKLWMCECEPKPVKVRVAIAEFDATCNKCGAEFVLQGGDDA